LPALWRFLEDNLPEDGERPVQKPLLQKNERVFCMPARQLFFLKVALTPPPLSGLHFVPSSGPEARSPYIHFVYVVCFAATGVASLRTRGGFVRLLYLSAAGGHFPAVYVYQIPNS
jgi:hypothetical protein